MGPVGWGPVRFSQTRPIPRSPDGDKNNTGLDTTIIGSYASIEVIVDLGPKSMTLIADCIKYNRLFFFSPVPSRTLPISPITPVAKDACARIRIPVPQAGIKDVVAGAVA